MEHYSYVYQLIYSLVSHNSRLITVLLKPDGETIIEECERAIEEDLNEQIMEIQTLFDPLKEEIMNSTRKSEGMNDTMGAATNASASDV